MSNYTMSPVVNGEKKQMIVKVGDTTPIGGIMDYAGSVVPDGWEQVSTPTILWTNSDTTADFTGQITLSDDITNYVYYEIVYKRVKSGSTYSSTGRAKTTDRIKINMMEAGTDYERTMSAMGTTTITFGDCNKYTTYGGSGTTANSFIIPYIILGYKKQIKKIAPVTPANGNIKNNYGTSQTDTYSQEYINGKTLGTSLYSNSSGTHEAFTLSEDIKHFREIEVTFGRSSWTNMKQKLRVVPQQSGTTPIGLIALYPTTDGNSLVLASAVFEIGSGGTNATFPRNTSGTIGSTGFVKDTATYVNVYEVIGYK